MNNSSAEKKYRGYIYSRSFKGIRSPQHVQNLVVRTFCQKKAAQFLLSSVEYTMPNSSWVLKRLLNDIASVDGLVFFSLWMLPSEELDRLQLYNEILEQKKSLHFALEEISLESFDEIQRIEDLFQIQSLLDSQNPIPEEFK